MSLKRKALSGLVWTYVQQFGSQLINFIVTLILARLLIPTDFGTIGLLFVFITIGNVIIDGGMGSSLIRTKEVDNDDYNTVFTTNILFSLFVYILIYFTAKFVEEFYRINGLALILQILALSILFSGFSSVQNAILVREMNFKRQTIIAFPSIIISAIVGISLALMGYGVWSLVVSYLVKNFINLAQLYYYSSWKPRFKFSKNKFNIHFNFGFKLMLISILDAVFLNIFPLIMGKFFSVRQVGLYTQAETLKQLPVSNITGAIGKVTFPLFATIQSDDEKLKNSYIKITELILSLLAPLLLFMAVLSKPILVFLYSSKWEEAAPFLSILCIASILPLVNMYNVNILKVRGKSSLLLKIELINKALIVISIVLLFPYGVYGLVWAKVVSSTFNFLVNSYFCGKEIHFSIFNQLNKIGGILLMALTASIIVYMTQNIIVSITEMQLFIVFFPLLCGSIIYLLGMWIFKRSVFKEIFSLISSLRKSNV